MSNVFIGQVSMFAGSFAPRHFALCNGQIMPIVQNNALFALLGTNYGGNGISTFGLPNLQSCVPVHAGQGIGLSSYALGQTGGVTSVTLNMATIPSHSHTLNATQTVATASAIANNLLPGQPTSGSTPAFYAAPVQGQPPLTPHRLNDGAVLPIGGNQPHTNLMPSLCISFIVALSGIFPSRN